MLLSAWETATSLVAPDAARLLTQLMGITQDSGSLPSEQAVPRAAEPVTPSSPASPSVPSVSADGGMSLLLTAITSLLVVVAAIALARLTVGEEFFSFLRGSH
jgi:hypothetical protein